MELVGLSFNQTAEIGDIKQNNLRMDPSSDGWSNFCMGIPVSGQSPDVVGFIPHIHFGKWYQSTRLFP